MTGIFKGLIRGGVVLGVLGALALGGMTLVAGKDATAIMLQDAQYSLREMIDDNIDDPAALRHQLMKLQEEYPDRIASVQRDLAELNTEIRYLTRDRDIAARVAELADEDLAVLEPVVSEWVDGGYNATQLTSTNPAPVQVRFQGKLLNMEQAAMQVQRIQSTRLAYENRAADADHDLGYLHQQAVRLEELLGKLESERAQFETQLSQLDRQIDAIERNERLISLMEKRQRTIDECSRYEAQSLDHVTDRLAEIRALQEAELDVLASAEAEVDYEEMARMQLQSERDALAPILELAPVR